MQWATIGSSARRHSGSTPRGVRSPAVEYLRRYPDMTIDIVAQGRMIDIVAEGYHAGPRPSELVPRDM